MSSKIMKLSMFGLLATLIALFSISLSMNNKNDDDLYLITPKNVVEQGANIKEIEKINEDKVMLTYVRQQQNMASVGYVKHDITLIETNYTFPFVRKYQMINGGFFTKDNQEQKNKYAILNQPVAFEMFGSMDIIGLKFTMAQEEYTVRGIINDASENKNIFIPMMLNDQNPNSFIIELDEKNGISIEYVQNQMKQVGITVENYHFINLGLAKEKISGKAGIASMIFLGCILVMLLFLCVKFLRERYALFSLVYKKLYLVDLLKSYPKEVIGAIIILSIILVFCSMLVQILLHLTDIYLNWNGAGQLPIISEAYFRDIFILLQKLTIYSNSIFIAFIVFLISFFICGYLLIKSESIK